MELNQIERNTLSDISYKLNNGTPIPEPLRIYHKFLITKELTSDQAKLHNNYGNLSVVEKLQFEILNQWNNDDKELTINQREFHTKLYNKLNKQLNKRDNEASFTWFQVCLPCFAGPEMYN
jgi:hypothetical protein